MVEAGARDRPAACAQTQTVRHNCLATFKLSLTVYVDPKHGIITSGRASTLEEAKAKLASWQNATSARLARCPELRLGFPITDCDPELGAGG
jgi:hypothetical protein